MWRSPPLPPQVRQQLCLPTVAEREESAASASIPYVSVRIVMSESECQAQPDGPGVQVPGRAVGERQNVPVQLRIERIVVPDASDPVLVRSAGHGVDDLGVLPVQEVLHLHARDELPDSQIEVLVEIQIDVEPGCANPFVQAFRSLM